MAALVQAQQAGNLTAMEVCMDSVSLNLSLHPITYSPHPLSQFLKPDRNLLLVTSRTLGLST